MLEQLRQQGLLVSAATLLKGLEGERGPDLPGLDKVAILTCDRPQLLKRLLESLVDNERRHGNRYHYLVFDDSRRIEHQRQNRALVQALREEGYRASYEGPEEQAARVQALTEALPEHREVIRWLLAREEKHRITTGRLGNHMLLATVGERFLHMDDDMVCRPVRLAHRREGIEISGRERVPFFFPDPISKEQALEPLEEDPLKAHGDVLGYTLSQACARLPASPDLDTFAHLKSPEMELASPHTPVLMTSTGTVGDPGTASNHWLYLIEDDAACRRFFASEAAYRRYRSHRDLWLSAERYQFNTSSSVMTSALRGIDQRALMPPFFPFGENVDYFFGGCVRYLHPHALGFDFPWSLGHLPEPVRRWPEDALDRPSGLSMLGFLGDIALGLTARSFSRHPERRLELLGETFLALADAEDKTLDGIVTERRMFLYTDTLSRLDRQRLRFPDAPPYWRKDMQRLMAAYGRAIQSHEETAWPPLREALGSLGEALRAWPGLWKVARALLKDNIFSP